MTKKDQDTILYVLQSDRNDAEKYDLLLSMGVTELDAYNFIVAWNMTGDIIDRDDFFEQIMGLDGKIVNMEDALDDRMNELFDEESSIKAVDSKKIEMALWNSEDIDDLTKVPARFQHTVDQMINYYFGAQDV